MNHNFVIIFAVLFFAVAVFADPTTLPPPPQIEAVNKMSELSIRVTMRDKLRARTDELNQSVQKLLSNLTYENQDKKRGPLNALWSDIYEVNKKLVALDIEGPYGLTALRILSTKIDQLGTRVDQAVEEEFQDAYNKSQTINTTQLINKGKMI